MTYRFANLQASTVSFIGALAFTAMLIVASAPHVAVA